MSSLADSLLEAIYTTTPHLGRFGKRAARIEKSEKSLCADLFYIRVISFSPPDELGRATIERSNKSSIPYLRERFFVLVFFHDSLFIFHDRKSSLRFSDAVLSLNGGLRRRIRPLKRFLLILASMGRILDFAAVKIRVRRVPKTFSANEPAKASRHLSRSLFNFFDFFDRTEMIHQPLPIFAGVPFLEVG